MKMVVFAGIVSGGLYAAALDIPDWGLQFTRFLPIYGGLVAGYLVAVVGVGRKTNWSLFRASLQYPPSISGQRLLVVIWITAGAFRFLVLFSDPSLSDDLYRYLWDGKVLLSGINPYAFSPQAQELTALRDAHWPLINNPDLPTIYPPLLILTFALAGLISHTPILWKLVMVLCDLAAAFFIMKTLEHRGRSRKWVILYLWHPLVVVEFASNGHADALGVLLVSAGLYLWARTRWLQSGMVLTLAGLVKFLPWVVLPLFLKRLGWKWALLPAMIVLFYLPFWLGEANPLGSLGTFAAKWRANDFLFSFLPLANFSDSTSGFSLAKWVAAAVVVVVWLLVVLLRRPLPSVYLWTLGTLLLVSPVVHPWYLVWLLPAMVFVPHPAWWVWTLTAILAYHPLPLFLQQGVWVENTLVKTLEYLPVLALVPVNIWLERMKPRYKKKPRQNGGAFP